MQRYFNDSYFTINIIFAGIIVLIIIYSGIFNAENDNHIIKSACIEIVGKPCKSVGLSRSFSEIVRFEFASAKQYNPYGIKIFAFFFIQLLLRIVSTLLITFSSIKRKYYLYPDILISILLFLVSFADFLTFWKFE